MKLDFKLKVKRGGKIMRLLRHEPNITFSDMMWQIASFFPEASTAEKIVIEIVPQEKKKKDNEK